MAEEEGSVMVDGEDFEADDQDQDTSIEPQDSTAQAEETWEPVNEFSGKLGPYGKR